MNPLKFFERKSELPKSELMEELNSHLNLAIADRISRGESPAAARANALREFGNLPLVADVTRERWGWLRAERLLQDLRYAFRTLVRDRGFAIVAVLILALGIGANIVVFSVVNTLLLRPLPFPQARQLVWLAGNNGIGGIPDTTYKVDTFQAFQQHNRSFQDVTAYVPFLTISEAKLTGLGQPKPVQGVWVDGNFFQTLGVQPYIGRQFLQNESVNYNSGGNPAVMLTYGFWKQQFHSDQQLIGKSINLSNRSYPVVGVLPAGFDFGSVFAPGVKVDFFIPISMNSLKDTGHALALVGRLRPGVSVAQAQSEANILFPQLRDSLHLDGVSDYQTVITGLKDHVSGQLRRSLIVLWCAVGLILLVVCVNLSNLFLARAAARSKEFALRVALGAGRGRLVRQLLTESLVLSTGGAILGLAIACAAIQYIAHQGSLALPLLSTVRIDATSLAWTLLLAVTVGLLFGIAPGLKIAAGNVHDCLKDSGPNASGGKKHEHLRSTLVISEIALTCVLLVGAGLLLRSFLHVMDVDLGFQPAHASAIKVDYDDGGNAVKRSAVLQEMLRRITAIPGIESAGITDNLPLENSRSWDLYGKGVSHPPGSSQGAFVQIVTPDYLRAMGVHLVEGRDFNWNDTPTSTPVIIINQAAAQREWPGQDPIGKVAINFGSDSHDVKVVGVVANVRESSVEENPSPEIYVPITQTDPEGANLVIRSALPLGVLSPSVMSTLRSINPGQPAAEFRPIQAIVDHSTSPRRFFATLVALFAALGLILATLGIYGVISYSVTRQTKEIGIRMALGATRERVQLDVIYKTLRMALIGIALGTIASFAVARAISSMLFGTQPTDLITFTAMALLLSAVALAAGYLPARRASRTNPISALRSN
jgi:predicted permease